ncbi:glycosyltransferase family 4 protein [Candidatus Saccharibacteria bacterium]|nr:glycosyltransferase family 4 protein [Candidatus Saccharibacteria bacterium]
MKILMLGWELPPHNSGGLGVACLNLARALSREGAEIDFVIPYTAEHNEADFMHILSATKLDPIHRYGGAYENLNLHNKIIPGNSTMFSIRDVQNSYCHYVDHLLATDTQSEHKEVVVHAHDWLTYEAGLIAKRKYHLPLVAHVHATEFDRAGGHRGNPLIHAIEQETLLAADRIIAVSEATKRIIYENYHIPLTKIDVIYNSLDEDFINKPYKLDDHLYSYIESQKQAGYTIITTVGRFTAQKGLHGLLHAAARAIKENPRLLFILAGDGEERNSLIALGAKLGISQNLLFTGFIRGQKLRDIYEISDIFVMSSISEPFGLTALEAAHHDNALILSKESGVSEIIWSAMKYNFWDEKKLADEILAISSNPSLKRELKRNIHQEYNKISWDKVAKQCLEVYNKSISHKRFN